MIQNKSKKTFHMKQFILYLILFFNVFFALAKSNKAFETISGKKDCCYDAPIISSENLSVSNLVLAPPVNDNFASATNISALIDAACSSGGAYTNVGATADQTKGSCWSGGPYSNVWYSFTATSTGFINIQIKVNGAGETMRYPMVALWSNATTQLQCQNQQGYGNGNSNLYYELLRFNCRDYLLFFS